MKLLKTMALCILAFFTIALTGCNNSFCSKEDAAKIQEAMYEKFEAKDEKFLTHITKKSQDEYYAIDKSNDLYKDKTDSEIEELRKKKVELIYGKEHPKACLTLGETKDPISGAVISGKSWGYAFGRDGGFIEGLLVYPIAAMLIFFTGLFKTPGVAQLLAILLGTFAIRLIVVLATFKQTIASQKIQLLTPEMNAINAKYDGMNDEASRNRKAMEMMNLYKKYKINPLTAMIGPFLTLPIFISMYGAVQASTVLRDGEIFGIALGQTLSSGILAWKPFAIILFILMIATQFLSMKVPQWVAKKKQRKHGNPNVKSQTDSTQNIMSYVMLFMIVFVGWMLPISMTIYWIASSVFSILQSLLLQNIMTKPHKPSKPEPKKSVLDQIRG